MGKSLALWMVITAWSCCLPALTPGLRAQQRVHVAYDSLHDKTVLHLENVVLNPDVQLSVVGTFDGRSIVHPDHDVLILTVWLTASPAASTENNVISIGLEGDALSWRGRAYPVSVPSGEFTQVLMAAVPIDLWWPLVDAERPVLTVGTQSFTIGEPVQDAVREYLARIEGQKHRTNPNR